MNSPWWYVRRLESYAHVKNSGKISCPPTNKSRSSLRGAWEKNCGWHPVFQLLSPTSNVACLGYLPLGEEGSFPISWKKWHHLNWSPCRWVHSHQTHKMFWTCMPKGVNISMQAFSINCTGGTESLGQEHMQWSTQECFWFKQNAEKWFSKPCFIFLHKHAKKFGVAANCLMRNTFTHEHVFQEDLLCFFRILSCKACGCWQSASWKNTWAPSALFN